VAVRSHGSITPGYRSDLEPLMQKASHFFVGYAALVARNGSRSVRILSAPKVPRPCTIVNA